MRDEQVRRYSRHILLPDVGGLGQTALLVATARVELRGDVAAHGGDDAGRDDPGRADAALTAAAYLAAGGVGTLIVRGASGAQRAELAAHGPDTAISPDVIVDEDGLERSIEVEVPAKPPWWPAAEGAGTALAFWRGGLAATRWMSNVANK